MKKAQPGAEANRGPRGPFWLNSMFASANKCVEKEGSLIVFYSRPHRRGGLLVTDG